MIGKCVDDKRRRIGDGLWYIEALRVLNTEPPKEVVTVATTRRLVTGTAGLPPVNSVAVQSKNLALVYLRLDVPYERCTDMPAGWFVPVDPPKFWSQPTTAAEAVTSRSTCTCNPATWGASARARNAASVTLGFRTGRSLRRPLSKGGKRRRLKFRNIQ
jgi:hypothetical protein